MAANVAFMLAWHGPGIWTVARASGRDVHCQRIDGEPTASAGLAAEAMRRWGYRGQGALLGLPSAITYMSALHCADLGRKDRRTALLYRFEEQLPVEAERLTADFAPPVGGNCLAIGVETAAVRPLIDDLLEHGVEVAVACPTAMLALWQYRRCGGRADYALVDDATRVCIFRMTGGHPIGGFSIEPLPEQVVRTLNAHLLSNPPGGATPGCAAIGRLDEGLLAAVADRVGLAVEPAAPDAAVELAARAAARALRGETAGWIDLRRDRLAPPRAWGRLARPIRIAVLLLLGLLTITAAASYYRSVQYRRQHAELRRQQRELYRKAYPDGPIPIDVSSRLRSELHRLAGISGNQWTPPERHGALDCLRRIVASMPPTLRWRLTDIRIDPNGIMLDGQARRHGDAELIAQSLRRNGGFATDSPKSESLAKGGVSFTISARHGVLTNESGGER